MHMGLHEDDPETRDLSLPGQLMTYFILGRFFGGGLRRSDVNCL